MGDTDLSLVVDLPGDIRALPGSGGCPETAHGLPGNPERVRAMPIRACRFWGEWRFHPRWSLHFQEGVVLPGDWMVPGPHRRAWLCGKAPIPELPGPALLPAGGLGCHCPVPDQYFSGQFRPGFRVYSSLGEVTLFTLPQTAFQLGVKKTFGDWILQ